MLSCSIGNISILTWRVKCLSLTLLIGKNTKNPDLLLFFPLTVNIFFGSMGLPLILAEKNI